MKTTALRFASAVAIAAGLMLTALPAAAQFSTPMRDIDNGARNPINFTVQMALFYNSGDPLARTDQSITVPAGKRLVIETISISAELEAGQVGSVRIGTVAGGANGFHYFGLTKMFSYPNGQDTIDVHTCLHNLRMYADPGSTITVFANRNTAAGFPLDAVFRVVMTGYYVTLP